MALKMLMMIVQSEHREKVESALTDHRVVGYTEIPTVYGTGRTGPRLGSRAFPEESSIIFTIVEDTNVRELLEAIEQSCGECRAGMRTIVWKVEQMI